MSTLGYQVLARKWRPRQFSSLVGQAHVVQALANALDKQRLHHAYLFAGTRGVGKTTVARIFAKALSCEQGISSTPCGKCTTCVEVDEGRYVDLVEVDAASRTKVDETRELLENVQYAPSRGRFKVYLIDEVHMFSGHSFNALLKTLEEPPEHVKFLLATTDPKRLPVTVLSRCLQFSLKRVTTEALDSHIRTVLAQEGIAADPNAIRLLAGAADGSVRDALSLVDQAIAFGDGRLAEADVRAWMGTVDEERVVQLLKHLGSGDAPGVFAAIRAIAEFDPDYGAVLGEMQRLLHDVALAALVDDSQAQDERRRHIRELADCIAVEDCQLFYQIALNGRRDLPLAIDSRCGFEMTVLRMLAFRRELLDSSSSWAIPADKSRTGEKISCDNSQYTDINTATSDRAEKSETNGGTVAAAVVSSESDAPIAPTSLQEHAPNSPSGADVAGSDPQLWFQMIEQLELTGMLRELALNCYLKSRSEGFIALAMPSSMSHLRNAKLEKRLAEQIKKRFGDVTKFSLDIEQVASDDSATRTPAGYLAKQHRDAVEAASSALASDRAVRELEDVFGAKILPESVRAIKEL